MKLRAVPIVISAHGAVFASEWVEASLGSYDLLDPFAATGILVWPDDDLIVAQGLGSPRLRAARAQFIEIEDEILERTCTAVEAAVSRAFVAVANEILARERRRRHIR